MVWSFLFVVRGRVTARGLWFDEAILEERVDGVFGLIEGDADLRRKVIEHLGTFRGDDGEAQLLCMLRHVVEVPSIDEQGVFETIFQSCQCVRFRDEQTVEGFDDLRQHRRISCGHGQRGITAWSLAVCRCSH